MEEKTVIVKMAEIEVVKKDGKTRLKLKTTLGSCVGVVLSDSSTGVHGLAHIMLPTRMKKDTAVGKYADTAIPAMLNMMEKKGAKKKDIKAYLLGGAAMFGSSNGDVINAIGEMNVNSTKKILDELGIPVVYMDTGGNQGRTVIFDVEEEKIAVKTLSKL